MFRGTVGQHSAISGRMRSRSTRFRPISDQFWWCLGQCWSNVVKFGPKLSEVGPNLVEIGPIARCRAKFGRTWSSSDRIVSKPVRDKIGRFRATFGRLVDSGPLLVDVGRDRAEDDRVRATCGRSGLDAENVDATWSNSGKHVVDPGPSWVEFGPKSVGIGQILAESDNCDTFRPQPTVDQIWVTSTRCRPIRITAQIAGSYGDTFPENCTVEQHRVRLPKGCAMFVLRERERDAWSGPTPHPRASSLRLRRRACCM